MELEECIRKANELSLNRIKPFTISESGVFKSEFKYPTYEIKVENDNRIVCGGDVLIRLYSPNGEFSVVFPDFKLHSKDRHIDMFEGGLPLCGQCWPPKIQSDSGTDVYAIYEIYDDENRRFLARYRTDDDCGCKVYDSVTNSYYVIYGVNDPGHSHNTLVKIK